MRELKPKCALRESFSISFGLLWPRGATTTNVDWTAVYREREREREQREGKGTLAACLHFRFFTPRLGFDCGLLWFKAAAGGSRQPVHVLGTWYTTRERSRERKGEEEEKSTCLAIVDSHSFWLQLEVYLMPTVLACCPRQIWHWLFKLSDREFVVTC